MKKSLGALVLTVGVLVATACRKDPPPAPAVVDAGAQASTVTDPVAPVANAAHGKELLLTFQCNRCHDGTGHPAAESGKHCVHCHEDIIEGRFKAKDDVIARWVPRVKDLQFAPSLTSTDKRLSRAFIEDYLLQPSPHFRPGLIQSMPRLALTVSDARDIAAYLHPDPDPPQKDAPAGDLDLGRKVVDGKGCGSCHTMTGVSPLVASPIPVNVAPKDFAKAKVLAPDLRFTRNRTNAASVAAWLKSPKAMKSDSVMPDIPLTDAEIAAATAYIMKADLAPLAPKPVPARLPVLTRRVTYEEVDKKVFHRTCWHCHSEPDFNIGDGGPGNSGGLGFKPRGLNLVSYEGMTAGMLDEKGERTSVFAKEKDDTPIMVRALINRYSEEAGGPTGEHRGMPLGYPALSLEEIQLVESWIAQGRPRGT
jgi:cytochrome c5